jgi:hypothetical protein
MFNGRTSYDVVGIFVIPPTNGRELSGSDATDETEVTEMS